MTVEQIVKRLLELIKEGKNVQAEQELYADDALSVEQNGHSVRGIEGIIAKTKGAFEGVQVHSSSTQAFAGADSFLLVFDMDMTPKDGARMQAREYGFYKVKDGKISEEYFFSQPLA